MASEAPSSVVSPVDEDCLSMSRYSEAASEFGRKLNLSGSARVDDMAAQTRVQAKRETQRPSGSRTAASGTAAESSRRQSARLAAAKDKGPARGGGGDDDDDSDDDEDDEDDDDDDDDPNPEPPQTPAAARLTAKDYVLAMMAAFEPRNLSPTEFSDADIRRLPEPSQSYRRLAEATASTIKTNDDLRRLLAAVPLNGTFWGEQITSKLQVRADKSFLAFRSVQQDAIETIEEVERVCASITNIFRRPYLNTMHHESKARLIILLVYMLDQIVAHVEDYRASAGRAAAAPVYAGGQNEYNLYLRFATVQANWSTYLNTMRELAHLPGVRALFEQPGATTYLRNAYTRLVQRYPTGAFPSDSVRNFVDRFRLFLRGLQIIS